MRTIGTLFLSAVLVFGQPWQRHAKPEDAGFSSARLEALRQWLATGGTTAMMVVADGKSLFEYGDLTHLSYLASVRKSVLAILYGKYVENGTIDLNKTLADLGMDDVEKLLPREKQAKIEHLITARSGVYHPASNPGRLRPMARKPTRGSDG